jgi:hypothetical protein
VTFKDSNVSVVEVRVSNITIPTQSNYFHCQAVSIPVPQQGHIIQFSPSGHNLDFSDIFVVVDNPLAHHLIFFECASQPNWTMGNCNDVPQNLDCTVLVYGWAPGSSTFNLPLNVGIPIGSQSFRVYLNYFRLNILVGYDSNSLR